MIFVSENAAGAAGGIWVSQPCRGRSVRCVEPGVEGIGWSCDEEKAGMVHAQEGGCIRGEDVGG